MGRRSGLMVIAIVLILAACSESRKGGTPTPATPSATPSTAGPTPSTPTTSSGGNGNTTKPKKRNIIAWLIGLGPGSPPGPVTSPEVSVYNALQSRRCRTTTPQQVNGTSSELNGDSFDLYVGAVAACMAAFNGGGNWSTAERALGTAPNGGHCFDATVRAVLEDLVRLHRENPAGTFVVQSGGGQPRSSCPDVTGVNPTLVQPDDLLTITGRNLRLVTGVSLRRKAAGQNDDWETIEDLFFEPGSDSIDVTMRDLSRYDIVERTQVRVVVEYRGQAIDSGVVTYAPPSNGSPGTGS